jgi:toxin secretion/phage lysis holin
MTENATTKGLVGAIIGLGAYLANRIDAVLVVLAIFLILDYIAGVTLALMQGEFDKKKGVQGAVKKLFYIVLVLLGFLLDFVISTVAQDAGLAFSTGGFLGLAVTLYLIGNEGLSILESLVGIGLPVPPFLQTAFGYVKDGSGKMVKIPKEESSDEGV